MTDARLIVQIDARPAEAGARRAGQALARLERDGRSVDGAFERMQRSVFGTKAALNDGTSAVVGITRAVAMLEAGLGPAINGTEALIAAQERLSGAAQGAAMTGRPADRLPGLADDSTIAFPGRSDAQIERADELASQVAALHRDLMAQIDALDQRYTPGTLAAGDATNAFSRALSKVKNTTGEVRQEVGAMADQLVDVTALGRAVGDVFADGFSTAILRGGDFREVLAGILDDLARIALQQANLGGLFGDLVGGLFAGLGGGAGAVGFKPKIIHAGGVAGVAPSLTRLPRFHGGGLSTDETLAVLRRKEEVLTADSPRHRDNFKPDGGQIIVHAPISIEAHAVGAGGIDPAAADIAGRQVRQAIRSAVQAELARQSRVGGILNRVA